ncbi:MAG: NADPH-adrenodoxin reductase [Claussenomyces sp. TS43310]|nr:MAG: NADPH-adrenodoxin reductase [Claussenomyces sp. TS43310]
MAVIGSGPAGFYTAYRVMSKIENAVIDMYEQLPVPFGLVRFGVAPDHPEVKNCQDKFQEVAESPNFNFVGNVTIGNRTGEMPLTSIAPHYDAILFAYGASKDRTLGIPGEDTLKGIYSARAFVGWYNGLPEYAGLTPDLAQAEEAVIVGQGNVALDVARILLTDLDELRKTDITEAATNALSRKRIRRVRVVGRRGALQAAFTIKEARELMNLPDVAFNPMDQSMVPSDPKKLPRAPRRIMELLVKGSAATSSTASKSWSLDFGLAPMSFNASADSPDRLSSMTFEKTTLVPDAFDPTARAVGTGRTVDLPADIAFRSIGYKSEVIPDASDLGVIFDHGRGVILNDDYGRVLHPIEVGGGEDIMTTQKHVPGMYCAGWVKRGPTGVIASTMNDAFATADAIARDWHSHASFIRSDKNVPWLNWDGVIKSEYDGPRLGWEGLRSEAEERGCRRVSWHDWVRIDQAERERGRRVGKEREKFTSISDMLSVLD